MAFALLTLFPGRVGGSEANVRGLLGQYAKGNGPERVTVLANAPVMDAYADYVGGPVGIRYVRTYRAGDGTLTRLLAMAGAAALPSLAARDVPRDFDVLHHPVTVPIPRLDGVPTVTTVHDVQHHELPGLFSPAERAYRRWAYDGAARAADLVVTSSDYSRGRLIDLVGIEPDRVIVVPMGIDHSRFTPEPTSADLELGQWLTLPERFVVYPANLWSHKNHDRLVEALAYVDDPDLALVLTGQDYGRRGALEERARRAGVGDRVHHLGFLGPEDVPALYRRATAMVFPSLYEGFGSPPLEAMACGCPVASSNRASLAEVVANAALTFDPEAPDEIAAAFTRIVEDGSLRATLRQRGLERAAEFTWEAAARRHTELYAHAADAM